MKNSIILTGCLWGCLSVPAMGQFPYGTTGLLQMPTADMNQDKTFMCGASFLNTHSTPKWNYNTYNYYINITLFPWLEIGYDCTLHKGEPGNYWPRSTWGRFVNQDRQFSVKVLVWKEKRYMPGMVLGGNDVLTRDWAWTDKKEDSGFGMPVNTGNGRWNRYFIAFTKHFPFQNVGKLGVHIAYVYNKRKEYPLNGPAIGANFQFQFLSKYFFAKAISNLNLMAEYDSRTTNLGAEYSLWKDYIHAVIEFNRCQYFSGGLVFKVHLK